MEVPGIDTTEVPDGIVGVGFAEETPADSSMHSEQLPTQISDAAVVVIADAAVVAVAEEEMASTIEMQAGEMSEPLSKSQIAELATLITTEMRRQHEDGENEPLLLEPEGVQRVSLQMTEYDRGEFATDGSVEANTLS